MHSIQRAKRGVAGCFDPPFISHVIHLNRLKNGLGEPLEIFATGTDRLLQFSYSF
jgi:hypothetical protein